jgi:ketosteroid isomerase-like protein
MNADRREANIRLVRRYLDALNAWDLDAIRDMTTEDVVFEVPFRPEGFERRTEGRDRYIELLHQASTVMIDGSENLHDIGVDTLGSNPDELFAEYRSAMKLRSGADYRNEYVARFSVRDGRISRFAEYMNPIILFRAMGGQIGSVASVANPSLLPQLLNTAGG